MENQMRKSITIIFCSLTLLGFSSKKKEQAIGKSLNHIEVAIPSFPKNIDPVNIWSYYHFMLIQSLYSTLVRLNEEGELVSHLAKSWVGDKSGKKFTIKLYPEAKFSNGAPVTAHDVVHSLARHAWPSNKSVIKGYLVDKIKGMNGLKDGKYPAGLIAKNNHELVIELEKPYPPFMEVLAMPGFSIVNKKDPQIGSGPMLGKYDKKRKMWDLEVNKDFYGKKTRLSTMSVRAVSGRKAIENSFQNKDIDIILGVPIGEVDKFDLPADTIVQETDTLSFNHLFYNSKHSLFKNKTFRKEFGQLVQNLAWNKKYLSRFLKKQDTFIPRGVMSIDYYENRGLTKASSKAKFLTKWSSKIKNKKMKIVVVKGHYNQDFLDAFEVLLKRLGIVATLKRVGGKEYMKVLRAEDYDIISGAYIGNFPDPDGFLEPLNPRSDMKYGIYDTSKVLKKLDKVRYTRDSKKRIDLYAKVLREFENEWPMIPLYRMNFPIIHHKSLKIPDSSYRYEAELWNVFWN